MPKASKPVANVEQGDTTGHDRQKDHPKGVAATLQHTIHACTNFNHTSPHLLKGHSGKVPFREAGEETL